MAETQTLLTLGLTHGTTARVIRALRSRAPLEDILGRPEEHRDLLTPAACSSILSGEAFRRAEQEQAAANARGIRILGLDEPDYPELLRQTYDPPAVLYVWGTITSVDDVPRAAIVGSRRATPRGAALARSMAKDLARRGVSIVSGLARGIDAAAHLGALDAYGRTFAVLGSGLDRIYPQEHASLAESITRAGAVVTEYSFGTPPLPLHFPRRNRVIAGLAHAVVVVEAGGRSGALGTARLALDEGRDVLAVPGWPGDAAADGTNRLIRDGAALVRDADDIAAELGLRLKDEAVACQSQNEEDVLLGVMRYGQPSTLEELQARSGWPAPEILSHLMELELGNRVRRLPGPLFVRS
jgi:DNA processing protein